MVRAIGTRVFELGRSFVTVVLLAESVVRDEVVECALAPVVVVAELAFMGGLLDVTGARVAVVLVVVVVVAEAVAAPSGAVDSMDVC